MRCPVCEETLQMTDRQGVEIDYCPKCRGVWLDRGELQKLIDLSIAQVEASTAVRELPRSESTAAHPHGAPNYTLEPRYEAPRYEPRYETPRYDTYHGKPKKRESWLGELFDWD